eukprot:jgi/Mesen1/8051/ME000043S07436
MDPSFHFEVEGVKSKPPSQSAWEIRDAANDVETEYAQNNTTSIDHKIQQLIRRNKLIKERSGQSRDERPEVQDAEEADEWEGERGIGNGRGGGRQSTSKGTKTRDADKRSEDEHLSINGAVDDDLLHADDIDSSSDEEDLGNEAIENVQQVEAVSRRDAKRKAFSSSGRKSKDEETDEEEDEGLERSSGALKARKPPAKAVQIEEVNGDRGVGGGKRGFFSRVEGTSFSAQSFSELKLSRPLAACVPLALTGRDICGSAVTGSGKTAAFALPVLERLLYRPRRVPATRVLILTPTRELAVQVHSMTEKLAQFTDIRTCLVVGGLSNKVQETALRTRPDIVVATPGRMIDHLRNAQSVGLEELAILVLDEADRLLEMGFSEEVQELVRLCPRRRQTLLFSATMTDEVAKLVQLSLNNPVRLSADPKTQRPASLSEEVVKIRGAQEGEKEAMLLALCSRSFQSRTIIFSGRKVEAHRLKIVFGLAGLKAGELHGNLTQAMRLDALEKFRTGETDFLIATDVAARGLDITGVETVINLECPRDITTYVHRVGRTARAGKRGCAVTFLGERDRLLLKAMVKRAGSQVRSRSVAPSAVAKWRAKIEAMEYDINAIAQHMMEHEAEIFAKPKKTGCEQDAKEGLAPAEQESAPVMSVDAAAELRRKEKRKLEREKNLPRKRRRKLEAAREAAEEDAMDDDDGGEGSEEKEQEEKPSQKRSKKDALPPPGKSLVDIAYRRAKASKSVERLKASGKIAPSSAAGKKDQGKKKQRATSRGQEMKELFKGDATGKGGGGGGGGGGSQDPSFVSAASGRPAGGPKKPARKPGVTKRQFKSKARFKRRK